MLRTACKRLRAPACKAASRSLSATAAVRFSAAKPARLYFYTVDDEGRLFLEGVKHRNFATCLKDPTFLDFFYKNLRPVSVLESPAMQQRFPDVPSELASKYAFVSICGRELNFVAADSTPIVYRDLVEQSNGEHVLTFAAKLSQPFEPDKLQLARDGRFYHPAPAFVGGMALLRSALTFELERDRVRKTASGDLLFEFAGRSFPLAKHSSFEQQ